MLRISVINGSSLFMMGQPEKDMVQPIRQFQKVLNPVDRFVLCFGNAEFDSHKLDQLTRQQRTVLLGLCKELKDFEIFLPKNHSLAQTQRYRRTLKKELMGSPGASDSEIAKIGLQYPEQIVQQLVPAYSHEWLPIFLFSHQGRELDQRFYDALEHSNKLDSLKQNTDERDLLLPINTLISEWQATGQILMISPRFIELLKHFGLNTVVVEEGGKVKLERTDSV